MDTRAFEELIRREHAGVYRAAARVFSVADRERAEDVAQSVFLRLLDGRLSLDGVRNEGAVLRHFAARLALEELRSSKSRRLREDRYMSDRQDSMSANQLRAGGALLETLEEQESLKRLAAEMEALEDDLRVSLALRFQEDWTFAEIADSEGCSEATAHARVNRGLEQLRSRMARVGTVGTLAALGLEQALAALPSPVVPSGLDLKLLALRGGVSAGTGFASWAALAGALVLAVTGAIFLVEPFSSEEVQDVSAISRGLVSEDEPSAVLSENLEPLGRRSLGAARSETAVEVSNAPMEARTREANGATLRGRFVDRDGAPIAALPVRLRTLGGKGGSNFRRDTRTTSTGDFEIVLTGEERARSRRFDLVALPREAGAWTRAVIDLVPDELRELGELRLVNLSASEVGSWRLDLALVDEGGQAVVGVKVLVFDADQQENDYAWNAQAQGHTDEVGECVLMGERLGVKRVVIDGRRRSFRKQVLEMTMLPGLARREVVTLQVGLTIRGRVLDVEEQVARGVVMNCQRIVEGLAQGFESELSGGVMAEDGSFLIRGLDPGEIEIQFSGSRWSTARVRAEAGTDNLNVRLKQLDDLRNIGEHDAEIHGSFVDASGVALEIDRWNVDALPMDASELTRFHRDVLPNAIWPMPRQVAMAAQTVSESSEAQAARLQRERLARLQFHETGLQTGTWMIVTAAEGKRGFAGPLELLPREIRTNVKVPALENCTVSGRVLDADGNLPEGRSLVLFTGTGPRSELRITAEHEAVIGRENERSHWARGGVRTNEKDGRFSRDDIPLGIEFRVVALHADYEPVSILMPTTAEERQRIELRFNKRR